MCESTLLSPTTKADEVPDFSEVAQIQSEEYWGITHYLLNIEKLLSTVFFFYFFFFFDKELMVF